ncbi:MAG TPA: chromosome partitioning protein [Porticoccaceae bacterium]|nr:chromosome partitioning protein [Porticoccaceae bacterium]
MHSVLVVNSKGGCGKTTIATNLAGYYAVRGKNVSLVDYDPQQSSIEWLENRGPERALINGIAGFKESVRIPQGTDVVVIDSPAGIQGRQLADLVRRADSIVMPILPSPIDVRAAEHFLSEVNKLRKVVNADVRFATVANRVKENTLAAHDLNDYLDALKLPSGRKLPVLASLRASQNYIRAAEKGLSIFEFAPVKTLPDRDQWARLIRWVSHSGKSGKSSKKAVGAKNPQKSKTARAA